LKYRDVCWLLRKAKPPRRRDQASAFARGGAPPAQLS
jgi:hypothetical protein